jgi:hypothetical protein
VEYVVLTFPRVHSKRSPQKTLMAWPSCPSHYCAAAVVESAYGGSVIVQSLLSSGASGDMCHSTHVGETRSCIVLTSYVFAEGNTFTSPKPGLSFLNLQFCILWPDIRLTNALSYVHNVHLLVLGKTAWCLLCSEKNAENRICSRAFKCLIFYN